MTIKQYLSHNKKLSAAALAIILVIVLMCSWLWWRHEHPPRYITQSCSEYSPMNDRFDGPTSIKEMADDSMAIVVATVDSNTLKGEFFPDSPVPSLKIKETLKGDLRKGSTISLCPGMGSAKWPADQIVTVVVFLENKDDNQWIPLWGPMGVLYQGKDDKFTVDDNAKEPKTISLSELRKIVR